MGDDLLGYKDFLQRISDEIHFFCRNYFSNDWVLIFQIFIKFLFLMTLIFLVDFIFKIAINFIYKTFLDKDKYPVSKAIYQARVTNSASHIVSLLFGKLALYSVFYRHPKSFTFLERLLDFVLVIIFANIVFRLIKALKVYYTLRQDSYKIIAINSISQTVKILAYSVSTVVAICVVFGISGTTILGSLGAITAMIVLVFRDTILGFVTGLHVATSKSLKVGDWIGIPKYNIEGNISDISLLTTKILNFDKTVSTIPTYDLLTTEIRNYQVMTESNLRRIKRSMIFNTKSFCFLNKEKIEKLKRITLIKDYLIGKEKEIDLAENADELSVINGRQLTNIGVFRKYVENYLKQNPYIEQNEIILVRQLELKPQGMPLEIYCFTIFSALADYEQVQADIFDHLMVAVRDFDLEITQTNNI